MSSPDKILRVLSPSNFVDSNNLYRIQSVNDNSPDISAKLSRNPNYSGLSYYAASGRRYKDLTSFLKKFRCSNCHVYGMMAAITNKNKDTSHLIDALVCTNCNHVAPLQLPIDRFNIGKTSTGVDKRPVISGKNTKFRMPISESEKIGLNKAMRKSYPNRNIGNSKTKLITDESDIKPSDTMMKTIHKHLRRANLPAPTNSTIMKVDDIDKQDYEFSQYMRGMGIIRQVSTPPEKVRQGIFLY
jgi:Pyruvate/2-oxoacid:ferredoxin oxidoreductase delta subunit